MTSAASLTRTHAASFAQTRSWSVEEFDTLLASSTTRLFGSSECFAILRCVADEAEILTLATHPNFQRQGRARAVLAEIDAQLRPTVTHLFLEVDEINQPARALYAAGGYGVIGRRKDYYAHPHGARTDALILGKNLT